MRAGGGARAAGWPSRDGRPYRRPACRPSGDLLDLARREAPHRMGRSPGAGRRTDAARWAVAYLISDAAGTPSAPSTRRATRRRYSPRSLGPSTGSSSPLEPVRRHVAEDRLRPVRRTAFRRPLPDFVGGARRCRASGPPFSGSYLFWVENELRYLYAPVDLAAATCSRPEASAAPGCSRRSRSISPGDAPLSSLPAPRAEPGGRATGSTGDSSRSRTPRSRPARTFPAHRNTTAGQKILRRRMSGRRGLPGLPNVVLIITDRNLPRRPPS